MPSDLPTDIGATSSADDLPQQRPFAVSEVFDADMRRSYDARRLLDLSEPKVHKLRRDIVVRNIAGNNRWLCDLCNEAVYL